MCQETDSILMILFDIFEYSDMQKKEIFERKQQDFKKKGFFGIFG
jgi:hypothetical protein